MGSKKTLTKAKPAFEAPELSKKVASTKMGAGKEKSPSLLEQAKSNKKKTEIATGTKTSVIADKLTKSTAGKSIEIAVAKPVTKKLKAPVKKTSIENTKDSKEVASPKKEVSEKKSKATSDVEKETKTPKASSKAAKAASAEINEVVVPKTSTDKKVDYEPDFMKSVLDTPASAPATPTMRYSDAELQEFRELIGKKLDAAKKELAYLQGLITRRDEMGGDETDNRYMTMEDGGMSMEREQLSQMASRQITFIDHLEKALMRIESKTYGICRVTGKLIDKARLRAVPHATLSMEGKLGITK